MKNKYDDFFNGNSIQTSEQGENSKPTDTVYLKLRNSAKYKPLVVVDGKLVKAEKSNEFGTLNYSAEVENPTAHVEIFRVLELSGRFWFLWHLLSFFCSLFGIFNPPYDKKCVAIDCEFIAPTGKEVTIVFNSSKSGEAAATIESESPVETLKNVFYTDTKAKKRRKIIIAFDIVFWLFLLAGIIVGIWFAFID